MATQYDGSINIDTKLHAVGFNAGMRKVEASARSSIGRVVQSVVTGTGRIGSFGKIALSVISGIGSALVGVIKFLGKLTIGLVAAFVAAIAFGERLIDSIQQNIDTQSKLYAQTQILREQFYRLQASILSIFSTLLVAALPTIIKIVDWLVRMLDIVNQVIAALTGQKTIQRVIASSVKETSDNAGKAAKNTGKLKKEAKGALAAFDQINVLAQKTTDDTAGIDSGAGADVGTGGFQFEEVPIDSKWLAFADMLKQKWLDMVQTIKDAWARFVEIWNAFWAGPIGQLILALVENAITMWQRLWKIAQETWQKIDEGLRRVFTGIGQFISGVLAGDWKRAWEGLKNIAGGVWDIIIAIVGGAVQAILTIWEGWKGAFLVMLEFWKNIFQVVWTAIQIIVAGAIGTIQGAWASLGEWFRSHVTEPIRRYFEDAINWIQDHFGGAFSGIANIARSEFNGLIDAINGILDRVANAINGIAGIANQFAFLTGLHMPTVNAPHIPHLATGAVIPPNAAFLAVMGDQKSGRNIEAPEGLIRQILREELGSIKADIQIEFTGTLSALARELMPKIKQENIRIGSSAIKSK